MDIVDLVSLPENLVISRPKLITNRNVEFRLIIDSESKE